MRLNLKNFLLLILTVWIASNHLLSSSPAAVPRDEEFYSAAVACRNKLNSSEAFASTEANWLRCINAFKLIYMQNVQTPLLENVLLDVGELYFALYERTKNSSYLRSALNSLRELYYYYPESKLAPKATFLAGDIYFKHLKQYAIAHAAYSRLLRFYSQSDAAREAGKRLEELAAYYTPSQPEGEPKSSLTEVNDIRHWTNPTYTRVVIDLEDRVPYKNYVLKNPDRLFVDLYGAQISGKLSERTIIINDGLLKSTRAAQNKPDRVRVVLDMNRIGNYKIFALDNPFRVIIDVSGNGKEGNNKASQTDTTKLKQSNSKEKLSLARQLGLVIRTVVIDPGHGGKDPGAIGSSGLMEKDVVLDLSKRLKRIIEESSGRKVYLTHSTDKFLPLEERTALANTLGADLFLSIHVNANYKPSTRGVQTYYLNLATTPEEEEIAARENQTSYKKISDLREILKSILLNSKIDESRTLAQNIQSSMVKGLEGRSYQTKDLGVSKAPFYVLIGANMPSVLVEASFISNPREEALLASSQYRESLARAIYNGLETYIAQMKSTPVMASK